MIDTLITMQDKIDTATVLSRLPIKSLDYFFLTMHRPSNVDCSIKLRKMCQGIVKLSEKITIIFAVHLRTRSFLEKYDLLYMLNDCDRVILLDPLGYIDMQAVMKYAKAVITDSGGLQEESTYLQIPCLTIRYNTERPVTINVGSNTLVGDDWTMINKLADEILSGSYKRSKFLGCAFVFNLLLNYLLVPKYHLWGALAAAIITLFFLNYCYMGYVKHKLGSFCFSLDALFILMLSLLLIVNTLFLKNLLLSIIIISAFSVGCIVRLIGYAKDLRHVKTI